MGYPPRKNAAPPEPGIPVNGYQLMENELYKGVEGLVEQTSLELASVYKAKRPSYVEALMWHGITRAGILYRQEYPQYDQYLSYHALIGSSPKDGSIRYLDFPDKHSILCTLQQLRNDVRSGLISPAKKNLMGLEGSALRIALNDDLEKLQEFFRARLGMIQN